MATTILRGNANTSILQSRSPNRSRRRVSSGYRGRVQPCDQSAVTSLTMGQVKILKRGEPLTSFFGNKTSETSGEIRDVDFRPGSTNNLGPESAAVQAQLRFSDPPLMYCGSEVFVNSPPPSSVPVPCFLGKIGTASSELRRLLRLDDAEKWNLRSVNREINQP